MKLILSFILIVFSCTICFGQKTMQKPEKAKSDARQIVLKKQILADEIDNQARDVPFAAARIFVRLKLAEWLWKDGKDETGRAEQIAVRALEEYYEKRDELRELTYLNSDLFALLELNAKDTAKKLRAKYDVGSGEDLSNAYSLLDKEGGDKIVAGKIKKFLAENKELDSIIFAMMRLREQKSPEFLAVLSEIINLEETGKNNFPADSLFWIVDDFRDSTVPNDLRVRFYRIVLNKARTALQSNDADEKQTADRLLYAVLSDINSNSPESSSEANALRAALSSQNSQWMRESEERYKRIEESTDKIAASIAEAEKTEDKGAKYLLYNQAARLATKEGKFQLAVDIYEKSVENLKPEDYPPLEFRYLYHDQQLREIVQTALDKDDVESARYATKKIFDELSKSEALRRTAIYFYTKNDTISAFDAYDESFKLTEKADNSEKLKFYALTRLFSIAQKLGSNRISEVTKITAEAINRMPTLNPDDKPETDNFKKYVSRMMATNFNIYSAVTNLVKENRTEAIDFASRINRKEIRIVADLALAINQIETETKQIKGK